MKTAQDADIADDERQQIMTDMENLEFSKTKAQIKHSKQHLFRDGAGRAQRAKREASQIED